MGAKLVDFYKQAAAEFGVTGRVKLAMLTKVPSDKAQDAVDSAESIKLFQQSIEEIRRQLSK